MATISPSPNSEPLPSGVPPPTSSATSPPPSSPAQSSPAAQPDANPPESSSPSPPSPPPNAPPPSNSETPPAASAPPPSPPITAQLPPTNALPPETPGVSLPPPPPPTDPPVSSPPPPTQSPPTSSPPNLPESSPPPQSLSAPPVNSPPPPSSSPPPTSSPTPPSSSPPPATSSRPPPLSSPPPPTSSPTPPSSNPPSHPPPPRPPPPPPPPPPTLPRPPENSPPPPVSRPPQRSPPAPALQAPRRSPPQPADRPPSSPPPPSRSSPPSPDSKSASPPSVTPVTPPASHISPPSLLSPPSPGSQTTVPSSPSVPANGPRFDAPQTATAGSNGGIGSGGAIGIGIVAGVLILGVIGLVALWIFKRKKRTSRANGGYIIPASLGSSPRSDSKLFVKTEYPAPLFGGGSGSDTPTDHGGFGHSTSWFTYEELYEATSGFSQQNLLGEGGFGCVYEGILADGRVVAVKQLKVGGGQGEREFKAEVEIISRIHHRHLVSLVGYCIWETKRLLVYDYVSNNTLHFHLHGEGRPVMDWPTRVKIAAGAARGITYLHEDCHPRIIHRDIKSSNILLDNNFEARVSDFGLAKLAMDADTHVSTRVMGTFGYLAPEYATSGKLTEKSDVYSFGVVLLELITGRKPVDESQPLGDEGLVEWARPLLTHALDTGEFDGLVDPRLEKNYIENEMFRMIEAAAACVRHSAAKRPRMGQVVRAFNSISNSGDLSNGLRVGESQLYDSAQQSAEIRLFRRMAFGSQDTTTDFFSQPTHILGFSNQSSGSRGGDISRQHSHTACISAQHSQNTGFNSNLNFTREDSLRR